MERKTETQTLPAVVQTAISTQKIDLGKVNFLLPTQTFGQVIGEYDKVVIEIVQIDPDEDAFPITKEKFSLGKRPLMAIANALGIIWDPRTTTVIESIERKSRAKATGAMRKPNGEWIIISEEKTVDLDAYEEEQRIAKQEDADKGPIIDWKQSERGRSYPVRGKWNSAAEKATFVDREVKKAMLQFRKFKDERAMTGAKERVIREFVALKNTYSRDELSKPFAFPRVIPDTSKMLEHPEVRKAAIEKMTGAVSSIFGPQPTSNVPQITPGVGIAPAIPETEETVDYEVQNGEHTGSTVEVPWEKEQKEKESEEDRQYREMIEELCASRKKWDKELPKDAKSFIDDVLKQEHPDPATISSLIDKMNDWEARFLATHHNPDYSNHPKGARK
jgi:hypothetical protein